MSVASAASLCLSLSLWSAGLSEVFAKLSGKQEMKGSHFAGLQQPDCWALLLISVCMGSARRRNRIIVGRPVESNASGSAGIWQTTAKCECNTAVLLKTKLSGTYQRKRKTQRVSKNSQEVGFCRHAGSGMRKRARRDPPGVRSGARWIPWRLVQYAVSVHCLGLTYYHKITGPMIMGSQLFLSHKMLTGPYPCYIWYIIQNSM